MDKEQLLSGKSSSAPPASTQIHQHHQTELLRWLMAVPSQAGSGWEHPAPQDTHFRSLELDFQPTRSSQPELGTFCADLDRPQNTHGAH